MDLSLTLPMAQERDEKCDLQLARYMDNSSSERSMSDVLHSCCAERVYSGYEMMKSATPLPVVYLPDDRRWVVLTPPRDRINFLINE